MRSKRRFRFCASGAGRGRPWGRGSQDNRSEPRSKIRPGLFLFEPVSVALAEEAAPGGFIRDEPVRTTSEDQGKAAGRWVGFSRSCNLLAALVRLRADLGDERPQPNRMPPQDLEIGL